jgi:hypothetical protein
MKTQAPTTPALRHSFTILKGKEKTVIKITLDDDCKNGHEDFSLTAYIYEKRGNNRWIDVGGGCCHEHILGLRPDLAPFAALHLSDMNGAPMHGAANAFYWFAGFNGGLGQEYHGGSGRDGKAPADCRRIFAEHIRATDAQLKEIVKANPRTQIELAAVLEDLGFPDQWKQEAAAAIRQLEEWTGQTFASRATRSHWEPVTPEQREVIAQRKASGYYSPEQVAARDAAAKLAARKARVDALLDDHKQNLDKLNRKLQVELHLAENFDGRLNAIYYDHSNELAFNWSSTEKLISRDEADQISRTLDFSKLPPGLILRFQAKPKY